MENNGLSNILETIGDSVKAKLSLNDEQMENIESIAESELGVIGTIDQDFTIKVINGTGSESASKKTWSVTITGDFEIKSPDEGTWTFLVKVAGKTVLDKDGVKKGDKIKFSAKTKYRTKVEIIVSWSEKKDTTLMVHMKASY